MKIYDVTQTQKEICTLALPIVENLRASRALDADKEFKLAVQTLSAAFDGVNAKITATNSDLKKDIADVKTGLGAPKKCGLRLTGTSY